MSRVAASERLAEAVADEAVRRCGPRSEGINGEQRAALVAAAPFVGATVGELVGMVDGRGNCAGEDTESFYPPYPEEPAKGTSRVAERGLARRLCGGCPVRGQCVALEYATVKGHVQDIWGIAGGLAARDRRQLLPLWIKLGRASVAAGRGGCPTPVQGEARGQVVSIARPCHRDTAGSPLSEASDDAAAAVGA